MPLSSNNKRPKKTQNGKAQSDSMFSALMPTLLNEIPSILTEGPLVYGVKKVMGDMANNDSSSKTKNESTALRNETPSKLSNQATKIVLEGSLCGLTPYSKNRMSVKKDQFLKDLAILCADAYGKKRYQLPRGCVLCDDYKTDSDLHAKLYRLSSGLYVCAFAGTDSLRDALEDLIQCLGLSPQFEDALNYGRWIAGRYGQNLIFTGHSQGGGEAAYCAYSLGLKACTFNPAGISRFTGWKIPNAQLKNARIHSYIFGYDALDLLQNFVSRIYPLLNIEADGNVHLVDDYSPEKLNLAHCHGMEGILRYFAITQ